MFGTILALLQIPGLIKGLISLVAKHVADPTVLATLKTHLEAVSVAAEVPEDMQQVALESKMLSSDKVYLWAVRATLEWVCIYALFMSVVVFPILATLNYPTPVIPMNMVENLLYALLGLGAARGIQSILGSNQSSD